MNTTTVRRLPRELMPSLFVAVPVRKDPGFLAHRVERIYRDKRTADVVTHQGDRAPVLIAPACTPTGSVPELRYHDLSAPMADALGAAACPAGACFPYAVEPASPPAEPVAEPVASVPPGGARPDETVWIASARKAIEAHRIDSGLTGCGRSTRTGEQLTARQAWDRHEVRWCRRCWPRTT